MISSKQLEILRFRVEPFKALCCEGAIRTGKTVWMIIGFITDAMHRYNGQRFGICGKTVSSAYKNIIVILLGIQWFADNSFVMTWRATENTLVVKRGNIVNYFELFGGKDESSYQLIQGRTLAGLFVDEVTLLVESFFNQAVARCSVAGAKLWFNCNPSSPSHWFKTEWIDKADEHNMKVLHFDLADNPALGDEQRRLYESSFHGVFYQRYVLGLWVMAEGSVYPEFNETACTCEIEDLPELSYIAVGQDFGGNKSKNTLCAVGISRSMTDVYVLRAIEGAAPGVSVKEITQMLDNFCSDIEERFGRVDYVFADSAEQAIINEERYATRWNIRNSIKNEIIDRIRAEDILMTSGRLHILRGQAESLVSAIKSAVWEDNKKEDTRLDVPGKTNICPLDAFEYSWEAWMKQLTRIGGG